MKKANLKFSRILALALVFLLALSAVIPAFAATGTAVTPETQTDLTITIKNNEGLPEMTSGQFTAYQLFTGTPNKETVPEGTTTNDWGAENWNNYTLADIQWGENVEGANLLKGLKAVASQTKDASKWPGFFDAEGHNIIGQYLAVETNKLDTAAELAAFLVGKDNSFLQEFSRFVLKGSTTGEPSTSGFLKGTGTASAVSYDADNPKDDESSITVNKAGYYLVVETGTHTGADAVSEYILAVLGDQVINLKASIPTVDKEIVDGTHGNKGDAAGVGNEVTFKLTGSLPKNFNDFTYYEYTFNDTLSKGLEFVKGAVGSELSKMTITVVLTTSSDPIKTISYEIPLINASQFHNGKFETPKDNPEHPYPDKEGYPELNFEEAQVYLVSNTEAPNLWIDFRDLKQLKGYELDKGGNRVDEEAGTILIPWDDATEIDQTQIVVTYKAKVTENAVILDEGNPNTVDLTFSNDPNNRSQGKTIEKKVYVYAFGLDLTKVGSDSAHASGLGGAGFVLKSGDSYAIFKDQYTNSTHDAFSDTEGGEYTEHVRRLIGWTSADTSPSTTEVTNVITAYEQAKAAYDNASKDAQADEASDVSKELARTKDELKAYLLESGSDGTIPDVYGLDEGTYTLKEVITPAGYNTMADFEFSISATINTSSGLLESIVYTHGESTTTYKLNYAAEEPGYTDSTNLAHHFENGLVADKLVNQKAPFLPFTGGMGTMIFYVLGVTLIAGAITYLVVVTKKRKKAEENA